MTFIIMISLILIFSLEVASEYKMNSLTHLQQYEIHVQKIFLIGLNMFF